MSPETSRIGVPGPQENAGQGVIPRWDIAAVAVAVLLVLCCTRGYFLGDTALYAGDIANSLNGAFVGPGNGLWDFGHILWRPTGWGLTRTGYPILERFTAWTPAQMASFVLIAISMTCGSVTVLLFYALALRAAGSRVTAAGVALGFGCSNAFLTFLHSGTPYLPGLCCVTLGVWLLERKGASASARDITAAGALASAGALFWMPYLFSIPAMALILLYPPAGGKTAAAGRRWARWRGTLRFGLAATLVLWVGIAAAAWARGIKSPAEARTWMSDSSHGWSQNKKIVRLATGLPRAFFFLGKDGILYKRFLLKDPYSPVTLKDLAEASLWKIALFDIFLLCLLYELLRRRGPLRPAAILLSGAVPVLFFAVFLFEPGSPERYFPAYPFLIMAVAWAMREFGRARRPAQWAIAASLACMTGSALYAMSRPNINAEDANNLGRVQSLIARLKTGSVVAVVSNQDALYATCARSPFNAAAQIRLDDVVGVGMDRVLEWRQGFANTVLRTWAAGLDVWVSKRFWAERPLPAWNWVEGDDRRVTWKELPAFFRGLETEEDAGGVDGFFKLRPGAPNSLRLSAYEKATRRDPPHEHVRQ